MHKGKYLQTSSGTNLGPGHFVSLLESAAGKTAEVLGKPNNSFFLSALGNISPDEAVMIGDDFAGIYLFYAPVLSLGTGTMYQVQGKFYIYDYVDDVLGAEAVGIHGLLVKTGKFKPGQDKKVKKSFPDISEAVKAILDHNETV